MFPQYHSHSSRGPAICSGMDGTVGVAGWVGLGVYWAEGLAARGACPSGMFTPPGEPEGMSM